MSVLENSKARTAEIITIGNEVLTGRVVNTNASFIARRLSVLGVSVRRIVVVADVEQDIVDAVRESINRGVDYLVTTGGLGPTYDDISMGSIAKAVGLPLRLNEVALGWVREKVHAENAELTPERQKMAMLPYPCKELDNPVGVAPGAWIEAGREGRKTNVIVLPGVPAEMEAMLEKHLIPVLVRGQNLFVSEREVRVIGIYEASLAPFVKKLIKNDPGLYVKTHPGHSAEHPSMLLHVEYASQSREEAEAKTKEALRQLVEEAKALGATISEVDSNPLGAQAGSTKT